MTLFQATVRGLELSLNDGITHTTAMSLCALSIVFYNLLGDTEFGIRLADVSIKLLDRTRTTRYGALVVMGIGQ